MSHPRFLVLAVPAAAVAALLFAAGAEAGGGGHGGGGGGGGHGGGGHAGGGGGHAGSFHSGGGNFHSGAGNWHGGNNFHGNNFHHDFDHRHGFGGVGFYFGPSWGYGYGGYPYDYGYGYSYGAAPYDYGYTAPAAIYNLDYSAPTYGAPPVMPQVGPQGDNQLQRQPADDTAHIEVRVPADAEVWFGSGKTSQTGTRREFVSPQLAPGKDFTYDIRARWIEGGKEVVQTRHIDVTAGAWKGVDFTKPPVETVEPPKPAKP